MQEARDLELQMYSDTDTLEQLIKTNAETKK